jgi:RHS repeat-associated protein
MHKHNMKKSILMDNDKAYILVNQQRVMTEYEYDAFGRRTISQDAGMDATRTLYDAFTFEAIREGVTFRDKTFTSNYIAGGTGLITPATPNHTEGERYRFITDEMDRMANNGTRYRPETSSTPARYTGINITLYGRGEAVAMNYAASTSTKGGAAYLGKDILGSVRSVSNSQAGLEDRYEYDAFGKPYKGDLENGMSLGYTGKPYDSATGMYDYGYRDYKPENARFTTLDPVRDGMNWFAYVNNDPVNYFDPFGLTANEPKPSTELARVANGKSFPVGMDASGLGTTMFVTSEWGDRLSITTPNGTTPPGHNGIDIAAPAGTRVNAVGAGTVTKVDSSTGYGNRIEIEHPSGASSLHGHLQDVYVKVGDTVVAGQNIATVGSTGNATGPHLHFGWDGNGDGDYSSTDANDNPISVLFGG